MVLRVETHPVLRKNPERKQVTIHFNDEAYVGYEGDTIASAMMAQGVYSLRQHEGSEKGRGVYCNIGHCYECRVKLDDKSVVRACLTPVYDGMKINSVLGSLERDECSCGTY